MTRFNFLIFIVLTLLVAPTIVFADFDELESESEYSQPKVERKSVNEPTGTDDTKTTDSSKKNLQNKETKNSTKKTDLAPKNKTKIKKQKKTQSKKKKVTTGKKVSNDTNKHPIKLKSNGLKGSRATGIVQLKSDVRITQGDLEITCDEAQIYFDDSREEVDKVVAEGNVRMKKIDSATKKKISSKSKKMIYEQKKGIVTLKGKVTIYRSGDVIKGQVLTYDLKTGWITGKKVDGMVQPKLEEQ